MKKKTIGKVMVNAVMKTKPPDWLIKGEQRPIDDVFEAVCSEAKKVVREVEKELKR